MSRFRVDPTGVYTVDTIVRILQIKFFLKSLSYGVTGVNFVNRLYFPYVIEGYERRFVNTNVYGKTEVSTAF